jgi:hypothetical protein
MKTIKYKSCTLRTTTYKQKKQKWIQKAKRKAKAAAGKK